MEPVQVACDEPLTTLEKVRKLLPAGKILGLVFITSVVIGPGLALGPLRGFLFGTLALCMLVLVALVRRPIVLSNYAKCFLVLAFSCGFMMCWHLLQGTVSVRYVLYLYYFVFTYGLFVAIYWALLNLNRAFVVNFITLFIFLSFALSVFELAAQVSVFSSIPIVSGDFQVGSGFWSNTNNVMVALLIFNAFIYLAGYHVRFYFLTVVTMVMALMLDAKIAFVMISGQAFLFLLVANIKVRVFFITLVALLIPLVSIIFSHELYVLWVTFTRAFDLLADRAQVQAIAMSGEMYSGAIRIYALHHMIDMISEFNVMDVLLGRGFGSINISFFNINWEGQVEYFSPHFFYLEIFIYTGLMFYLIYAVSIRLLSGRFPWKLVVMLVPCFVSIVAVSSAVYFPPLYFLMAMLCVFEVEKNRAGRNEVFTRTSKEKV